MLAQDQVDKDTKWTAMVLTVLPEEQVITLISRTARTRKQTAFTLIEMLVIVVLLALFSAMVAPNLIAMRDGQQRRALYTSVADLAGQARELAIANAATTYLQVDTSANALVLKQEDNATTYQSSSASTSSTGDTQVVNGRVQSTRTKSNVGTNSLDHSNDKALKSLPLAPGIQFGNFQLVGQSSDSGSWKLHFYADGSCDGGGVELTESKSTKSLVVNSRGGSQVVDGSIPDTSQDRWTAGDYVHRQ